METIHMSGRTMDHGICVLFFKSACQIGAYVYNKRRAYGRCGLMSCRVDEAYNKGQPVKEASRDYIQRGVTSETEMLAMQLAHL